MRKPTFCVGEKKGPDQCFVFATQMVQFLYFIDPNFKPLAVFCACTAWFVSDLFGSPENQFSCDVAHIVFGAYNLKIFVINL